MTVQRCSETCWGERERKRMLQTFYQCLLDYSLRRTLFYNKIYTLSKGPRTLIYKNIYPFEGLWIFLRLVCFKSYSSWTCRLIVKSYDSSTKSVFFLRLFSLFYIKFVQDSNKYSKGSTTFLTFILRTKNYLIEALYLYVSLN